MATTANYPKVAFVVPWYGRDIPGGAERQTRDTAHHLAQAGVDITILTTCIKDFYSDWGKNHHRAGTTTENGIPVHRFPVQKRNRAEFDRVNTKLIHGLPITPTEEATYTIEMIKSPTLLDHIHQHQNHYIFIFLPYLFSTTLFGSTIAPTRSIIIPCLHDEPYARLPSIQKPLANAHTLIFNSHPEADLANQLVPAATTQPRLVTGEGVTMDEERGNPDRFKQKYDIDNFVLYSGRREAGKNTPLLLDYWGRYQADRDRTSLRSQTETEKKLIFTGSGDLGELPPNCIDLGFIPKQDLRDAMAAATLFCLPSVNESFSLVLMQSWLEKTPALVHAECAVTADHVRRANGGLYFSTYDEFAATVDYLFNEPAVSQKMGGNGEAYVRENFGWDKITARYIDAIKNVAQAV